MPTTRTLFIDQYRLPASTDEFVSANRMRVTVGTNFPTGSTEHSRTVFILEDAGAEIRCGLNSEEVRPVDRIETVLGGDPEYETFLDALKFFGTREKLPWFAR